MLSDKAYVLKQIEERDIHFIRLWFTDALGNLKNIAVTNSEIENAFEYGMGFDGSAIAGFGGKGGGKRADRNGGKKEEKGVANLTSDLLAFPIANTFQVLPWRPKTNGVARMFCDIKTPDGEAFCGDPRYILRKVVKKARDMGYVANVGSEIEYYYFENDEAPTPIDRAGYFDLTTADHASDLRRDTILTLEKMSIPVEYSHHEISPSQQEIDLRFADALSMADALQTYKLVVKEIALTHGMYASFMPLPATGLNGSGMHLHQSLFDLQGNNAFFDESDPLGLNLSDIAKQYMAGVLKYAPEYMLLTNQYVNSYKRLTSTSRLRKCVCWSNTQRSAIVRVPSYRAGSEMSSRIELRLPDPSANPYLALAATIAAGLAGIEEGLELPAACDGGCKCGDGAGDAEGAHAHVHAEKLPTEKLPTTLSGALNRFEKSELMRQVLGEHTFNYILQAKRDECAEFDRIVTNWEVDKYLPLL